MSTQVRCFISFSCDTMKDEILTDTCMKVLHEAASSGFTEEEIKNVMKMAQNKLERSGTSDSTWLFKTLDALKAAAQASTADVAETIETIVSQRAHKELLGLIPSSDNDAAVNNFGEELRSACQDMLANGERMLIVRYRPLKL